MHPKDSDSVISRSFRSPAGEDIVRAVFIRVYRCPSVAKLPFSAPGAARQFAGHAFGQNFSPYRSTVCPPEGPVRAFPQLRYRQRIWMTTRSQPYVPPGNWLFISYPGVDVLKTLLQLALLGQSGHFRQARYDEWIKTHVDSWWDSAPAHQTPGASTDALGSLPEYSVPSPRGSYRL